MAVKLFALAPNDSKSNVEITVNGIVDRLLDVFSFALRLIRGRNEQTNNDNNSNSIDSDDWCYYQ